MNNVNPIIERARKAEELRKERIRQSIDDLEIYVNSCNYRTLHTTYLLGEEKKTLEQAEKIARLIAQFELDCGCFIKP